MRVFQNIKLSKHTAIQIGRKFIEVDLESYSLKHHDADSPFVVRIKDSNRFRELNAGDEKYVQTIQRHAVTMQIFDRKFNLFYCNRLHPTQWYLYENDRCYVEFNTQLISLDITPKPTNIYGYYIKTEVFLPCKPSDKFQLLKEALEINVPRQ